MIGVADDNLALIWDVASGNLTRLTHLSPVRTAVLSTNGELALTGCSDGSLQLWNVNTGKAIGLVEKYGQVLAALLSADGKHAVTISDQWIHTSSLSGKGLKHEAARLIPWWYSPPRILDPTAQSFRLLTSVAPDTIEIEDINFETAPAPKTSAAELLNEWQAKLSAKLDRGQIVAKWNELPW